jgi:hypothetical protein
VSSETNAGGSLIGSAAGSNQTIGSFQQGQYPSRNVEGSAIIRVTNLVTWNNAVVSGIFFD